MARDLEEPDRALRREAWELVANRRLQEAEKFEHIFDQLIRLREPISRNAGCANYRDYAFRMNRRFDYTTEDCPRFHDALERNRMPSPRGRQVERRRQRKPSERRPGTLTD